METVCDITDDILRALSASGLAPTAERGAHFDLIHVGPDISFIVTGGFDATPEEAARRSALIASLLDSLRGNGGGPGISGTGTLSTGTSGPGRRQTMVVAADLWLGHREMMLGRMLAHCGIFTRVFARNCEVRRIEKPLADAFMNAWHSYGTALCRHRYGLFTLKDTALRGVPASGGQALSGPPVVPAGTLVAAAEFSNAYRGGHYGGKAASHEWIRYASLPNMRVCGGMGKVLKKFIDDVHPYDIVTYADLEWSDGRVYRQLGFEDDGRKAPVLFSIDGRTLRRTPLTGSRKTSGPGQDDAPSPGAAAQDRQGAPIADMQTKGPRQETAGPYFQNWGSLKYRLTIQCSQAR